MQKGDSAATNENALFISENTLEMLIKSSDVLVEYLLDSFKKEYAEICENL